MRLLSIGLCLQFLGCYHPSNLSAVRAMWYEAGASGNLTPIIVERSTAFGAYAAYHSASLRWGGGIYSAVPLAASHRLDRAQRSAAELQETALELQRIQTRQR